MKGFAGLLFVGVLFGQNPPWMGQTSGYVYFGFNGAGTGGPNIFTTAKSADGKTNWQNLGGSWSDYFSGAASGVRVPFQINAPDCIPISGVYYCLDSAANDQNNNLVTWFLAQGNATTGELDTLFSVDWSSKIANLKSCFAGGFTRNFDLRQTIYVDGSNQIHAHIPCSSTDTAHFKVFETHANLSCFTSANCWSDPADTGVNMTNVYDPQVYFDGTTFWMWLKDGTNAFIVLASSSNVASGFTMQKTGDWAGWGSGLEGVFAFKTATTGWVLIFEAYVTAHQMYYSTCSTNDFTACTWTPKIPWTEDALYRHGLVVTLQ